MSPSEDNDDAHTQPASFVVRYVGNGLAALVTLASLAWAADLYRTVGLVFLNEQFYAGMLALGMPALFILLPASRAWGRRLHVPWYDLVAAAITCAASLYVMVNYQAMTLDYSSATEVTFVVAAVLLAGLVEGLRRSTGTVMFVFVLTFLAFGLLGHYIPGPLQGENVSVNRLITYVALDANGVFGPAMKVSATVVIAFIFFGFLLGPAGAARFFTDIATALMGRFRGGPAKIAIVASSLFGSISGSAVANVVATGVVTIPMMVKGGYSRTSAGAVEAVASTGGQLMPPLMGVAAFVMAELLQVDYAKVVIAALLPAILYYLALFIVVDLQAKRENLQPVDAALIPKVWPVLKAGFLLVIPFVVIVLCLFTWHLQPETAALYAAISLLPIGFLLGYRGEKLRFADFGPLLVQTGHACLELLMIGAAAGVIMGVLNISGLGFALTLELVAFAGHNLLLLLALAAVTCIILGMGMPTLGVYILLATLVAPAIVQLGVPAMAAHLFVLYFGLMSMITPPVAIAAFAAAAIAKAPMMKTGWQAVRYGWAAFIVPFLFVYSPSLIMRGPVWEIVFTFVTAAGGVWAFSAAVIGYSVRPLNVGWRLLYSAAGIALLLPIDAFPHAIWPNVAGMIAVPVMTGVHLLRKVDVPLPLNPQCAPQVDS